MADILIIDHADDPLMADVAFGICNGADYSVAFANHGLDAFERLVAGKFAVAVVNVRSPNRDGVLLATIVRERCKQERLSLVAVVGDITVSEHVALRAAGMDHVLQRPCSPGALHRTIEDALREPIRSPGLLEALARAYGAIGGMSTRFAPETIEHHGHLGQSTLH